MCVWMQPSIYTHTRAEGPLAGMNIANKSNYHRPQSLKKPVISTYSQHVCESVNDMHWCMKDFFLHQLAIQAMYGYAVCVFNFSASLCYHLAPIHFCFMDKWQRGHIQQQQQKSSSYQWKMDENEAKKRNVSIDDTQREIPRLNSVGVSLNITTDNEKKGSEKKSEWRRDESQEQNAKQFLRMENAQKNSIVGAHSMIRNKRSRFVTITLDTRVNIGCVLHSDCMASKLPMEHSKN